MVYDEDTPIGLSWARITDVRTAYDWTIDDVFRRLSADRILGVEAPLWSETVERPEDFRVRSAPESASSSGA